MLLRLMLQVTLASPFTLSASADAVFKGKLIKTELILILTPDLHGKQRLLLLLMFM